MKATSILPLSLAQKDFAFPRGNRNASVRFKGELSVPALRRALANILKRHEGLRMRVSRANGEPQQRIAEALDSFDLPVICVSDYAAAEQHLKVCVGSPVDLENDGPFHAQLLRVGADDHILLLAIHSIAIDAHALALLLRELLSSYDGYARGQEPTLPPAMRYSDYVLDELRCGEKLSAAQIRHWQPVLSGSRDPIPRRVDHPAGSIGTARAAASSITSTEAKQVQQVATAAHVSLATALHAVIFLAVASQYSVDDIIATVTYSGRDSRALETLCAKTSRLFPLRMLVNRAMPLVQFMRNLQSAFICGVMASRAPFTAERAAAQALAGDGPQAQPVAEEGSHRQGMRLVIADDRMPKAPLDLATPHLSAERILLGPRPYEGTEEDGTALFRDAFVLSLIRDPSLEARRPVIFSGAFYTHLVSEREAGRLLQKMWAIARLTRPENQDLTVGELLSKLPGANSGGASPTPAG